MLARRVHLGDGDRIGGGERTCELACKVSRPGVEMRLEQHEQPATVAHRGERRGDLGRMVRVVVEDFDAPSLAAAFQAPSRAGELGKYRLGLAAPHSGQLECGYGAGGIATVVFAGDSERPIVWRQMISPHGALRRNRCEPVFKELLDLRTRSVPYAQQRDE